MEWTAANMYEDDSELLRQRFNPLLIHHSLLLSWADDDEDELVLQGCKIIHQAVLDAFYRQKRICHPYLTRPSLLLNSRSETPWTSLWQRFRDAWERGPLGRADVDETATPRPGRRSLDAFQVSGDRYIRHALTLLKETLMTMEDARIEWPSHEQIVENSNIIHNRHPLLLSGFGFVDGLSLPIKTPTDEELQEEYYNGWKKTHCVSNLLVFSPDGCIIWASINDPGRYNDSRVAGNLYPVLLDPTRTPGAYYLIADTAFPRVSDRLKQKIKAPIKSNDRLAQDPVERHTLQQFSSELTSCRQAVEWGMRALQGSFTRLKRKLPGGGTQNGDDNYRIDLISTCLHRFNLRTRRVEINQIKRVYEGL
ncbi:hypothetical protein SmJEL517_g06157 [Synchytrium microbalum]|uniref:DDE Tnp4 domain-containing protein n=1 Tax=Synchytrium microbalum TaxID=1806994 RepID=A0A507BWV6_9FUNG|nr:uncharacterized protein SmJEL517_g06157 [Synchytrium microbalum]TPX30236.1 hypothetical protein SmJEL517_g06157 [Synchytrium microbalum]